MLNSTNSTQRRVKVRRIGIFTVGGSTDPIINAIKNEGFDYVLFVCSSGKPEVASERLVDGNPLKQGEKIIAVETGLSHDKYKKILLDVSVIDDINAIYGELESKLLPEVNSLVDQWRNVEVIANYTGGTKSMSVALVLLAIYQQGWDLQINAGTRTNLIKIDSGDFPIPINKVNLNYRGEKIHFEYFMSKFYYEEILERVERLLRDKTLLPELRQELMILRNILRVLILWDKFEHEKAEIELDNILKGLSEESEIYKRMHLYRIWLKKINGKIKKSEFGKVIDLFYNAKRRAEQERFDDAVARYYRAIEMLGQLRLLNKYNIDSSNIKCNELEGLPEKTRVLLNKLCEKKSDERGRLKIGLVDDYEVLESYDDELGKFYFERKKQLLNALERRNSSILAHGIKPILKDDFKEIEPIFEDFIVGGLKSLGVDIKEGLQLPKGFRDIGMS